MIGFLRVVLILVEIVACLLLIGVILLQKSKSEGLGLAFGSGVGETLFGSRAGNILTKTTVVLAVIFLLNTAFLGLVFTHRAERSIIDRKLGDAGASHMAPAPAKATAGGMARPPTTLPPGAALDDEGVTVAPSPATVEMPATPSSGEVPAEPAPATVPP